MRTTIIFKDGSTATFQSAYQIYVDTDSLIINYEYYKTLGDAMLGLDSPSHNTACYDISEIAAVVKGECNLYEFRN